MSCTNPVFIVNPTYAQKCYFYPFLFLNGVERYWNPPIDTRFDYSMFSKYLRGLTSDNYQKYVAANISGETIDIFLKVSCGKCDSCRKAKQIDICNQMTLEQYSHKTAPIFITLTYSDKFLPSEGVNVDDCQRFFKRLRFHMQENGFDPGFRYALFSEYGKEKGRPHYHAVLYGVQSYCASDFLRFKNVVSKAWTLGFTWTVLCDSGVFRYVSKYVVKGSNVPLHKNPNFRLTSRRNGGLGVPSFNLPELYERYLMSPNGIITINLCGKDVEVYIPKAIRRSCFKNLNDKTPTQLKKTIQRGIYQASIIKSALEHNNELSDYVYGILYQKCQNDSTFSACCDYIRHLLPRWLREKYPFVSETWTSSLCPSYHWNFDIANIGTLDCAVEDLSNIVKYLLNFKFDLHFYLENVYLRELVIQPMLERMAEYRIENTVDVQKAIDSIYIHNIERAVSKDFQ